MPNRPKEDTDIDVLEDQCNFAKLMKAAGFVAQCPWHQPLMVPSEEFPGCLLLASIELHHLTYFEAVIPGASCLLQGLRTGSSGISTSRAGFSACRMRMSSGSGASLPGQGRCR